MSNISRRSFLQRGAAAAAAFSIVPGSILGKSHGYVAPTDKLNIAAVGIGGMGHANIKLATTSYPASFREILPDKNDIFVCIQAPFSYRYRTLITRDWMNKFSFYTNIGKASKCFPLKA